MPSAEQSRSALSDLLEDRLQGTAGADWLAGQDPAADLDTVRRLLPEASRAMGRRHLVGGFAERQGAHVAGVWGPVHVGEWKVDEAASVLLLARCADAAEAPYEALFTSYDQGDTPTRLAALRALNFVAAGAPERGLDLVRDAGRTYLTELLSGAWCNNPFSAQHLSDQEYRKAVLKAFFCEVPVEGFLRLEERADAELAQSLCEYIDERLAAGRTVPRAIWAVAALHPRAGLVARLIGNIEHPDAQERLAAARALANARDARAHSFVVERLEREDDPTVRDALELARQRCETQE